MGKVRCLLLRTVIQFARKFKEDTVIGAYRTFTIFVVACIPEAASISVP